MEIRTYREFKQFLDGASMALTGKRASTHKGKQNVPRPEAAEESWWRSTGRDDGHSEDSLNRNRAYLLSYFEAAGQRLPALGLHWEDGSYTWPDRSVIERSLRDGHVRFVTEDRSFELTEEGKMFLSQNWG